MGGFNPFILVTSACSAVRRSFGRSPARWSLDWEPAVPSLSVVESPPSRRCHGNSNFFGSKLAKGKTHNFIQQFSSPRGFSNLGWLEFNCLDSQEHVPQKGTRACTTNQRQLGIAHTHGYEGVLTYDPCLVVCQKLPCSSFSAEHYGPWVAQI